MTETVEVVEYTDLLCGWAWGGDPHIRALRWRYGDDIRWRRVMSCIIDMPPLATSEADAAFADSWSKTASETAEVTGAPWPTRIAPSPRTSVLPSLVVKAAERQSDAIGDRVARRVRERLYVFGKPVNDVDEAFEAVARVPGLDAERLRHDLDDPDVQAAYDADVEEAMQPNDDALRQSGGPRAGVSQVGDRWRYAFPSLVFRGPAGERSVCGWSPYEAYADALDAVAPGLTPRPDPDPSTMLTTFGSATRVDFAVLCDGAPPPTDAIVFDAGGGPLFLSGDEASARRSRR
jgi:predicted DsbA family dithiol-disulfide isomerase